MYNSFGTGLILLLFSACSFCKKTVPDRQPDIYAYTHEWRGKAEFATRTLSINRGLVSAFIRRDSHVLPETPSLDAVNPANPTAGTPTPKSLRALALLSRPSESAQEGTSLSENTMCLRRSRSVAPPDGQRYLTTSTLCQSPHLSRGWSKTPAVDLHPIRIHLGSKLLIFWMATQIHIRFCPSLLLSSIALA